MNRSRTISLENLLIDVIITLIAINYIDISVFVESSIPLMIYLLIPIQSAIFLQLYGDIADKTADDSVVTGITGTLRSLVMGFLGFFAMFAWALGYIWLLSPLEYLNARFGVEFYWAAPFSFFVALIAGLIILVRVFTGGKSSEEYKKIEGFRKSRYDTRTLAERIVMPVYGYVLYGTFAKSGYHYWFWYFVSFGFLVYTETLFEIIVASESVRPVLIIGTMILSYFPMRMILLLRQPFSVFELISAFGAFCIFLYSLIW